MASRSQAAFAISATADDTRRPPPPFPLPPAGGGRGLKSQLSTIADERLQPSRKFGARHDALLVRIHVEQRHAFLLDLLLAENDRCPCLEAVGPSQSALNFAGIALLDDKAHIPQLLRQPERKFF